MKCAQAKRLFGAYWDDDTTQAEREWLESHFVSCPKCRNEYEDLARVLEWTASLPRVEPAPDLVERTLARARRAANTTDRIPVAGAPWIPVTAGAALLLVVATLVSPWVGLWPGSRSSHDAERRAVRQPQLVRSEPPSSPTGSNRSGAAGAYGPSVAGAMATVPDSLFNHGEDVEFVLDPVTLRRGKGTVTRVPPRPQGAQAVITF
jgi:predicted anti-sigma-YlaC factor YlaD